MQVQKQTLSWGEDNNLVHRSTREVIEDHIRLQVTGALEEDLQRNYAEDAVLLTDSGSAQSGESLRRNLAHLYSSTPGASYEMRSLQVHGETGMLVWKARLPAFSVDCGVDSFVVVDGKIRIQTSHYAPVQNEPANEGLANP